MKYQPCFTRITSLFLGVILVFALGLLGCNGTSNTIEESAVPPVDVSTLKELFPETVGKGQPVVIDFYSQFCLGCQALSPKLEKAVRENPGVTLQTLDIQKDDPGVKAATQALGVATVPFVLFINGEGKITRVILEDTPQSEVSAAVQAIAPKQAS